jgi:thermitase
VFPTQEAPGEQAVLIQFGPEVSTAARDAQIARLGGRLVRWMPQIHVAEVALPGEAGVAAAFAATAAPAGADILFVEPDQPVTAAYVPADPDFADSSRTYGLDRIQAQAAWDTTTGSPAVIVAVVDSGIQLDHPEFAGRLAPGYDFVNEDDQPEDETGHGTHVAGIIAAGMDDGNGVAGVCPHCRLMPVKVLNSANRGSWADVAAGVLYAADHGARIINLSLGAPDYIQTLAEAIAYARSKGIIVVASSGNYGSIKPFYPAMLDTVIAVGATTAQDVRWDRSNYGPHLDLVAPGDLIYSTFFQPDNSDQGHTYLSGTSMAAPFVSGLVGLLVSLHPTLTDAEVWQALMAGADDLGAPGYDIEYGYGRINAYRSLARQQLFLPSIAN